MIREAPGEATLHYACFPVDHTFLPYDAPLEAYDRQAAALLEGWRVGDATALAILRHKHPRLLRADVPWLPLDATDAQIGQLALTLEDARLVVARGYDFLGWPELAQYVRDVRQVDSQAARFEAAVEAVIDGDVASLLAHLDRDPTLVSARSARVTCFDPPVHGAMLLHYVAANGVENHRQRTPANAVDVARLLIERGANVDALAYLYGGACTTMSLLVSSDHPRRAGVQVALVDLLVEHGASVEPLGTGSWTSPLVTALVFGCREAAEALVRLGARVDSVVSAAGLGRTDDVRRLLPTADGEDRHRALALAAQNGHADTMAVLLDAGEDPNRYNPPGTHAHSTPLHQAAWSGHLDVVRLLVERGARLDLRDAHHDSTPLGWADYAGQTAVAAYLRGTMAR